MEKNTFEKVFIEDEKKTVRRYLETLMKQLDADDFNGVETYAGYLLKSASKLIAYQTVSEIAFAGENN